MSTWESSCRIKKVMQRDRFGCGIACAAMIAARSYSDARSVIAERGLGAKKAHSPPTFRNYVVAWSLWESTPN